MRVGGWVDVCVWGGVWMGGWRLWLVGGARGWVMVGVVLQVVGHGVDAD